ncbi:MAG: hypothetical protein GXP29_08615 [Planctomycetes bacterium]|nr:hypothetical protein [Planctomycetota bacterium]
MSDSMVPRQMFFTKGVGKHRHNLQSFEAALRRAGIAQFNLVRVSSIFPPNCKIVSRERGLKQLKAGAIVHCVIADIRTDQPTRGRRYWVGAAGEKT